MEACLTPADTIEGDTLGSLMGGLRSSEWRSRYRGKVDQIWVDLCRQHPLAIIFCQTFLKAYVRLGKVSRLTLGPEEVVEEQAVKYADSLNSFWKTLIAEADDSVMMPLRNADSANSNRLLLKRPMGWLGAKDEGPVAQVTQVSRHATLAPLTAV